MVKILWVDDEVELLKPHVLFLRQKGYEVETCNNGYDAIDMASETAYDLIILDEMMPGIHQQRLVTEQTAADYRSEFGRISQSLQMADTFADWCSLYRRLTGWEIELADAADPGIREVLAYQKSEANQEFSKFVRRNYRDWINRRTDDTPVMSHTLMRSKILPEAERHAKTCGSTTTRRAARTSTRRSSCGGCSYSRASSTGSGRSTSSYAPSRAGASWTTSAASPTPTSR